MKLNYLEKFAMSLRVRGGVFKIRISLYDLERAIAEEFGVGTYYRKTVLEPMIKFGLIAETAPGIYDICVGKSETEISHDAESILKKLDGAAPEGTREVEAKA